MEQSREYEFNFSHVQPDSYNEQPIYPVLETMNNNQVQPIVAGQLQRAYTFSTDFENTTDNPPAYEDVLRNSGPVHRINATHVTNSVNQELPLLSNPVNMNSAFPAGYNMFTEYQRSQSVIGFPQPYCSSELVSTAEIDVAIQNAPLSRNNPNDSVLDDVRTIKNCFTLLSFDYKRFGNVILNRTIERRQQIIQSYKTAYGKNLRSQIASRTSGTIQYLFLSFLFPVSFAEAYWLCDAMNGFRVNTSIINEIMGTKAKNQLMCIVSAYSQLNRETLLSKISCLTERQYRRFITLLCSDARLINNNVDNDSIDDAITTIYTTTHSIFKRSKSLLAVIFAHSSGMRMKEIANAFERKYNYTLISHLKNVTGGSLRNIYLRKVSYCNNPTKYYCNCLNMAVKNKDLNSLIRIIVSRETVDLSKILVAYKSLYGKSLQTDIKKKFKSYTGQALYKFLGEDRQNNIDYVS